MMEVLKNNFILLIVFFSLFVDLLVGLQGITIPAVLSLIFAYLIYLMTKSLIVFVIVFLILFGILYIVKLNNFAQKINTSTSGIFHLDILFMPIKKLVGTLDKDYRLYLRLVDQKGFFRKKIGDNVYRIFFTIAGTHTCYCDEPLEWGDVVKVKKVKDGKIYVEKVS